MEFDLRREMRAYGLQRDLAKDMGVSIAYVSAVYTGKKPVPDKLLSLLGWERTVTTKVTYRRKKEKANEHMDVGSDQDSPHRSRS